MRRSLPFRSDAGLALEPLAGARLVRRNAVLGVHVRARPATTAATVQVEQVSTGAHREVLVEAIEDVRGDHVPWRVQGSTLERDRDRVGGGSDREEGERL